MVENNLNQTGSHSRVKDFTLSNTFYDGLIRTFAPSNNSRFSRTDTVEFLNTGAQSNQNSQASNRVNRESSTASTGTGASTRVSQNPGSNPNTSTRSYTDSNRYSGSRVGQRFGSIDRGGSATDTNGSHLGRFNQRLIKMFDRDGDGRVSDQEVLDYVKARRSANQAISDRIKGVNSNAAQIISLVELSDPNNDGVVTDEELINAVLELRANSQEELDQGILDLVTATNPNRAEILKAVIGTDLDKTGNISDIEVLTALLNENNLNVNQEILYKVLSNNDQFDEIKTFLDSIDINPDGVMSNEEVFNFLMAFRGSGFSIKKSDLVGFLNDNPNLSEIENSIEYFDPNANGDIDPSEFLNGILGIESGAEEGTHTTVLDILNNNSRYQSIREIFNALDTNTDGSYSENELVQGWLNFKKGDLNADSDIFYTVINSLSKTSNLGNLLNGLDLNNDNQIQDTELIDLIMKLRSASVTGVNSETLTAINGLNANSDSINEAINTIDEDNNGMIDNQELIKTVLANRRAELNIDNSTLSTVLNYNENLNEIIGIIDLVDVNRDGNFTEDEILDVLINQRRGILDVSDPGLLDDLIQSSPNLQPAVDALNLFDPDKNGFFEENNYIQALMQIRKGDAVSPSESLKTRIDSELADSELINEVISSMDPDADGVISVSELLQNYSKTYITAGVPDLAKKAVLDRVLAVTNPDAADILALRDAIDTDHSGTISDHEAAMGILRIRSGELVDIGKQNLIDLLSDNINVEAIYNAIEEIDSNTDGVIDDNEVFSELIQNAKAGIQNLSNAKDQVLSINSKYNDYKAIFAALDINSDGSYTETELIQSWIKFKKGELSLNETDLYKAINELSAVPSLTGLLKSVDVNEDGTINNPEMVDFLMGLRLNGIGDLPAEVLNTIYGLNSDKDVLESAINAIDTAADGTISTNEVVDAIISMRKRELAIDSQTFNQILDYNPNRAEIETLIDFIDVDGDGVFNETELFDSIIATRKNPSSVSDINLFNELVQGSENSAAVLSVLNTYDPDSNGIFEEADYIRGQISVRKSEIEAPSSSILNKINTEVAQSNLINELVSSMDPNSDGVISSTELITNYYPSFITGGVPDLNKKAVLDRILEITNPGAQDILNIRDLFDLDHSGTISDQEVITGLLKVRTGEITDLGRDTFVGLLADNPNVGKLYDAIDLIDRDDNGRIEFYEIMARLIAYQKSGTGNPIEEEVLAVNPSYVQMKNEIESYRVDWSLTGEDLDTNLRGIMLQIRNKEVSGLYFDLMLASMGKAYLIEEKLLKELFDSNRDNAISTDELVRGLERRFNNEIAISDIQIDNILKKTPKYKFAYDLIKAEFDAGRTLNYADLAAQIDSRF